MNGQHPNGDGRTGRRLHSTIADQPRAFLVGVEVFVEHRSWSAEDSLEELTLLADSTLR